MHKVRRAIRTFRQKFLSITANGKKANSDGKGGAFVPSGHFYSPIANPDDIRGQEAEIWTRRDLMPGVNMNEEAQLELLTQLKPHVGQIEYPIERSADPAQYYYANDQFFVLDAEFLFAALCHFRPKSIIEVGSGFSSMVTADANRRIFGNEIDFTCIEPYPRRFLKDSVDGITNIVRKKVQEVDIDFFSRLKSGDILFIDSSHVSKIGSDVNYLFFEILPRLKAGVIVHVHDIYLPDEYPKIWMIDENRSWNEQYILRCFLQHNAEWEVLWAANYIKTRHPAALQEVFPHSFEEAFSRFPKVGVGNSFWMRRKGRAGA